MTTGRPEGKRKWRNPPWFAPLSACSARPPAPGHSCGSRQPSPSRVSEAGRSRGVGALSAQATRIWVGVRVRAIAAGRRRTGRPRRGARCRAEGAVGGGQTPERRPEHKPSTPLGNPPSRASQARKLALCHAKARRRCDRCSRGAWRSPRAFFSGAARVHARRPWCSLSWAPKWLLPSIR